MIESKYKETILRKRFSFIITYDINVYVYRGGLRTMAFSPDNQMLASGGVNNLIIWSLQGQGSIIKHFERQGGSQQPGGTNYGAMMGMAPGSG